MRSSISPLSPLVVRWIRVTFFGWSLGFALILVCIALFGLVGLGNAQVPVGWGWASAWDCFRGGWWPSAREGALVGWSLPPWG